MGGAPEGCNRERKCHIPRISPPVLCTKAKGGVLMGHYSIYIYSIRYSLAVCKLP